MTVDGQIVGQIGSGLLILLGIGQDDEERQARLLADKIVYLRIFGDGEGKMNRSLLDVGGSILVVSQFTLYADMHRGRRPSFVGAAAPAHAIPLIEHFKACIASYGISVENGIFGAHMHVELVNDGPVTLWLDTAEL